MPVQMGDLAAGIEQALLAAVPAGRDFGSGPVGEREPLDRPRRAFRSAERLRPSAWVGGECAKRISAERECEPVFFMRAARWFSTVRWLMNAGPAAREPRIGLSRMLSYHTPLNPTAKLCIATTLAFSDGALVRTRTVLS
jgi:hypothetical protein